MKDRAPAFQFYPRQFAGDDEVMAMDLDAIGAHILLMCAAGASPECCRIAADERAIRNRVRNPGDEDWQRIKSQLLHGAWKVSADGLWWEQDGLRRSFEKQRAFSEAQSEKAKKRYRSSAHALPSECQTPAEQLPEAMPQSCSSSSSSSSKQRSAAAPSVSIQYPEWLPLEAWQGFVEIRKKLRAPLTDRALKAIFKDLEKLRAQGENLEAVLDQSTTRAWRTVYPVKGDSRPEVPRSESAANPVPTFQHRSTAISLSDIRAGSTEPVQ